jgi:hypothetical protein
MDGTSLYFQLTANLPRSKSRVRIPCPALPFHKLRTSFLGFYPKSTPLENSVYERGFKRLQRLDPALHGGLRLDVQIDVDAVSLLISNEFWIHASIVHQRRMRSPHDAELHPIRPDRFQPWPNVPVEHVFTADRRGELFGRESQPSGPCLVMKTAIVSNPVGARAIVRRASRPSQSSAHRCLAYKLVL